MSVSENLKTIIDKITAICDENLRNPSSVNLIAVSKKQPQDRVQAALDMGHRLFGENRVQEAQQRWQNLRVLYPDLKLHLIGPLQTNKVKEAVELFDVIEVLDREKLARALSDEMKKQQKVLPCFIQVNTGDEVQKSGITLQELDAFYEACKRDWGLNITGLMCIPPVEDPPALHFGLLKKYADHLGLKDLSMGMSSDFEKAIALGATYIRLGTAVFGERA